MAGITVPIALWGTAIGALTAGELGERIGGREALSVGAAAQSPSAEHSQLLSAARAQQPTLIASLKKMVLIESGSNDKAGLMAMADYTQSQLNDLGAKTEHIPASTETGDLVEGTFTGSGKLRIMLQGHMDTVYPKGILSTQLYHQDGNIAQLKAAEVAGGILA